MSFERILFVTVGGSHRPIVHAIDDLQPDFVCFICTDRDPASGQKGSRQQIEGAGNVIAEAHGGPLTLPNIPTQCGLKPEQYEVLLVEADNLDDISDKARTRITTLSEQHPGASLYADYTGGTKSMTAGLVLAAVDDPRVELTLVTGTRNTLISVHDGSEALAPAEIDRIRLDRRMEPHLQAWHHHGYGEAAAGLQRIPTPRNSELRTRLLTARDLSRAFDAWDRFDHAGALQILQPYQARLGAHFGQGLTFLRLLADNAETNPRTEPARLLDLWLNAERRAARHRYDDAVARTYRLLEWTAQWILRRQAGIDTSNLQPEEIPSGFDIPPGRHGKRQAGLFLAWQLVLELGHGEPVHFMKAEETSLRGHLDARNVSILAHGYMPVRAEDWVPIQKWFSERFIPMLQAEVDTVGRPVLPRQLPTCLEDTIQALKNEPVPRESA